jgi:hypothetical protein
VGDFPDPELAVIDAVSARFAAGITYAGARTLVSIQAGKMPAVRARRTGDAGSDEITDRSLIELAVFAEDADTAKSLAEGCRQDLVTEPGISTGHGLIDFVRQDDGPRLATSPDTPQRQAVTSVYAVSMRRGA